jgi:hypothetical protein
VVIYDAKSADDLAPYADPALDQYASSHGLALRIVAADVVDETGKTPKYLAPYIQAAAGKPLPVVLIGKAGVVKKTLPTPSDAQAVIAWIEKTVGENPDLAANGFWAGGQWRRLGSVRPMRPGAAAKWPAEGSDQAEPLIPLEKIKEVSLAAYAGRIADQQSYSSCCPTSACSLLELMGERSGMRPVKLSAADLYSRIATGDHGSMLDDAWAQLTQVGVCTTEYCVEQGWYRKPPLKPGYQLSRSKNRALRVTYCQDFASIASALNRMKPVHYGLFVDNGFSPDADGMIGEKRRRGGGGHAVLAVGLKKIAGEWYILTENSWGPNWSGSKDGSVPKGMALIHRSYADEGAVFGAFAVSSIVSPSDDPIASAGPAARSGLGVKSNLEGDTISQAKKEGTVAYASAFGPLNKRLRDAVVGVKVRLPAVADLGAVLDPTAIARLIVAVIVDPVNRVLGTGAFSHVGAERLERVTPAVTHLDATTAIIREVVGLRIGAAINHLAPNPVFGCCGQSVPALIGAGATAVLAIRQVVRANDFGAPAASATTEPSRSAFGWLRFCNYQKQAILPADAILKIGIPPDRLRVSHDTSFLARGVEVSAARCSNIGAARSLYGGLDSRSSTDSTIPSAPAAQPLAVPAAPLAPAIREGRSNAIARGEQAAASRRGVDGITYATGL